MKTCRICGADKPLGEFHKRTKSADGLQSRCKECARLADAARYADPLKRAAINAYSRQYSRDHRVEQAAKDRARRHAKNPPGVALVAPAGTKHCGKCGEAKPLAEFHRQRSAADGRASQCRACAAIAGRARYEAKRDEIIAQIKEYRRRFPDRVRVAQYAGTMRYWARRRGASPTGVKVTRKEIEARWAMWGDCCYLCGSAAVASDHVIPLSTGGLHVPANLRPICQTCNSRKGARPWRQFAAAAA